MNLSRPELPAYGLAGLLITAIAVLAGLHASIPAVLPYALLAIVGAGAGVSLNALSATQSGQSPASTSSPTAAAASAAPAATAAPSVPAPAASAPVAAPTVTPVAA